MGDRTKICSGCLSQGRVLYVIDKYRDIYDAIVSNDTFTTSRVKEGVLSLCFECKSVLKRCWKFKNNAVEAQERLRQWDSDRPDATIHPSTAALSTLGLSEINRLNISPLNALKSNSTTSPISQSKDINTQHKYNHNLHTFELSVAIEPLQEVKTESEFNHDLLSDCIRESTDVYPTPSICRIAKVESTRTEEQSGSVKKSVKLVKLPPDVCKRLKLRPTGKVLGDIQAARNLFQSLVAVPKIEKIVAKQLPISDIASNSTNPSLAKLKKSLNKKAPSVATAKKSKKLVRRITKVKKEKIIKPKRLSRSFAVPDLSDNENAEVKTKFSARQIKNKFTKMLESSGINPVDLSMIKVHVMSDEDVEANREQLRTEDQYLMSKYKCHSCIVGYYSKQQLDDHVATKHVQRDPATVRCAVCAAFIPTAQYLFHFGRHRVRYECRPCARHYSEPRQLTRHYSVAHAAVYKCARCGKLFKVESNLRRHIAKLLCPSLLDKSERRYTCDICKKTFLTKDVLRTHVKSHMQKIKPMHCVICKKWYKSAILLATHKKRVHERDSTKEFRCEECDITFVNQTRLNAHFKKTIKHGSTAGFKHVCEVCGKGSLTRRDLEKHMNFWHKGVTEFVCDLCSKMFANATGLKKHIKYVHEGQEKAAIRECPICEKQFKSYKAAKDHMNIHTGRRPYVCAVCGDTFRQAASLYTHNRRLHLGVRKVKTRAQMKTKRLIEEVE